MAELQELEEEFNQVNKQNNRNFLIYFSFRQQKKI